MSKNYLPLLLVSTSDLEGASKLVSEIIDSEVFDGDKRLRNGRMWRIKNKYYCVDIEICTVLDGDSAPPALEDLEAHIIYITKEEMEAAERVAEARWAAAGAARAHVRLAVCATESDDAVRGWALRRGYEPVALTEPAAEDGADDDAGVERVRAALHAHAWRDLRRLDRAEGVAAGDEEDEEGEAVERAEAFAEALGALQGATPPPAGLSDAQRRRRAERLVAAFCRALGEAP